MHPAKQQISIRPNLNFNTNGTWNTNVVNEALIQLHLNITSCNTSQMQIKTQFERQNGLQKRSKPTNL